jgi:hypothetical protein
MTNSRRVRMLIALSALGFTLAAASCRYEPPRTEGLDPARMPERVRADYSLFALRCSKCHSLSRPLQSGITDDGFWAEYVERMRRQPGSGITSEDTIPILRFLHYFSTGQLAKHDPVPFGEDKPLPSVPPLQRDGGSE